MKEEKKDKVAIALEYTPENDAPVVIATGKGALAEKFWMEQRKRIFRYIMTSLWQKHCQNWSWVR